ncbi:hypothetical protein C0995_011645 [Termitomyces sp. Mi166|nr:hypothetical protein C0995_011645 [Termitomyces sp. Mi166\
MPRKDAPSGPISAQAQQDLVSDGIENFELPKSLVTKIAKSALPDNAKLQKETVLSLVKGSTVFINYLAATAHDVAVSKQHKSISASDVLKALEMIEFGDLVERLQTELVVYRANAKTDKKKIPPPSSVSASASASASIAASASASASASAPPRPPAGKGKAKPKDLGAPFTSAPLIHHALQAQPNQMEVDWEEELGEAAEASLSRAGEYAAHDQEGEEMGEEGEGEGEEGLYDQDQEEDQDEGDEAVDEDEGDEEGGEEIEKPIEVEEVRRLEDAHGVGSNGVGIRGEEPRV